MIKKAVVLAAGEGKRLKPFTETMPKVMLPVANKPILKHVFDAVQKSGVEELIVVVGYKKEVIMDYFRDQNNITYVVQEKQLGTAHALLQAREHVNEPFIVLAGDNIIDHKSISKMIQSRSNISILVKEHPSPSKYGVVFLEKNRLKRIVEKPRDETSKFISTGIYRFPNSIFDEINRLTSQGVYDLTSLIQSLLDHGNEIQTIVADQWMDVVYPWDIIDVNEAMIHDAPSLLGGNIGRGVTMKGRVTVGKDTTIYTGSYIQGPVVIGEGCEIGPNVCVFPSTVIGNNVVIHPFSEIRNSVIMDEVHIGSNAFISHSVIGKGSRIKSHFSTIPGRSTVEIEGEFKKLSNIGAIVGEDCSISSHVVVEAGRIIGRRCEIKSFKRVAEDVPSESKVM